MILTNTATADIFVHLIDLPDKTKETVCPNEDGSFTIFINSCLSYDAQLKAYEHAVKHIRQDDFTKENVQLIEYNAHKSIENSNTVPIPAVKYLEELERIRKRRRKLQRQMKKDEERIRFLEENCDMFERMEHHYLYGNDL